MELDDAVLAHAYGELGDSAACALWEGFLRCVRVLSCEHESRSNVCSDMFISGTETNKAVVACVPRASLVWRVADSHVLTQSALSTSCFAPSS